MDKASKKSQLGSVSPNNNEEQEYIYTEPRYLLMNSGHPNMYTEDSLNRMVIYPKEIINSNKKKVFKRVEYNEGSKNISSKHTNKEVEMSQIRKVSSISLNKNNSLFSSKYFKPCVAASTCLVSLLIITGL